MIEFLTMIIVNRRAVMDYIFAETIIISIGLALSAIKLIQLIVLEITEDMGIKFDTQSRTYYN